MRQVTRLAGTSTKATQWFNVGQPALSSKMEKSLNFFYTDTGTCIFTRFLNWNLSWTCPLHSWLSTLSVDIQFIPYQFCNKGKYLPPVTVQQKKDKIAKPGTLCPAFWDKLVSSLVSPVDQKKTRTPNHLQMRLWGSSALYQLRKPFGNN